MKSEVYVKVDESQLIDKVNWVYKMNKSLAALLGWAQNNISKSSAYTYLALSPNTQVSNFHRSF